LKSIICISLAPSIGTSLENPPVPRTYSMPSTNLTAILSSGPGTSATNTNSPSPLIRSYTQFFVSCSLA